MVDHGRHRSFAKGTVQSRGTCGASAIRSRSRPMRSSIGAFALQPSRADGADKVAEESKRQDSKWPPDQAPASAPVRQADVRAGSRPVPRKRPPARWRMRCRSSRTTRPRTPSSPRSAAAPSGTHVRTWVDQYSPAQLRSFIMRLARTNRLTRRSSKRISSSIQTSDLVRLSSRLSTGPSWPRTRARRRP